MAYNPRGQRPRVTSADIKVLESELSAVQNAQRAAKRAWQAANVLATNEIRALEAQQQRLLARQQREWAEPIDHDKADRELAEAVAAIAAKANLDPEVEEADDEGEDPNKPTSKDIDFRSLPIEERKRIVWANAAAQGWTPERTAEHWAKVQAKRSHGR